MISRQYTKKRAEEKKFRCRLMSFFLVQSHPCTRIRINRDTDFCKYPLEQEFQSKLNQPRIRPSRSTRHHSEVRIICRAANRVWGRELGPIKYVEELRAEFQSQPFVAPKPRPLEYSKIKVTDSLGSQSGVYPRLIPENEIGRRRKTSCIEPFRNSPGSIPRHRAHTAGKYVRP